MLGGLRVGFGWFGFGFDVYAASGLILGGFDACDFGVGAWERLFGRVLLLLLGWDFRVFQGVDFGVFFVFSRSDLRG